MKRLEDIMDNSEITRIKFIEGQQVSVYYDFIRCSDVIMDPYPFGGCNTSLDSIALGKPIVTLPGPLINGRFTYGFYKKMGMTDLIAKNIKDYINICVRLAQDKPYYNKMCNKIKERAHLVFEEQKSVDDWQNMLVQMIDEYNAKM